MVMVCVCVCMVCECVCVRVLTDGDGVCTNVCSHNYMVIGSVNGMKCYVANHN